MKDHTIDILKKLAQAIYDKKGFNILGLDVRGVVSYTDFFLIAEGTVERHVQALARELQETLRELNYPLIYSEGEQYGDWIILDCGDIMIHLFIKELREKYALEQLWQNAKIVDLEIHIPADSSNKERNP